MPRRRRHEEHENHEAWAIPYGDLVTLLLAFFVVMYAMSSVNEGKYRVLSDSLTEAFHGTPHSPQPVVLGPMPAPSIQQMPLAQVQRMITAGLPIQGPVPPAVARNPAPATAQPHRDAVVSNDAAAAAAARSAELDAVASDVTAAMAGLIGSGQVRVHRYENWVAVDISTDILFGSGVARLSGSAVSVLQRLADALRPWPNPIRVEGHTDDRPINTAAFPSNWELSTARAASVVHLFMDRGVAAQRLSVMGFGEYRPVMPNQTAVGRNANRRVEVAILDRDNGAAGGAP
jgi:chemotaxis protein MotB